MTVRLFISNLPYNVTREELKKFFSTVGPISYLYLPTDQATGKPRGFAFLDYDDRAQAEEAVRRFNNQMFMGRAITVSEARAREGRPPIGGRERPPGVAPQRLANQPASVPPPRSSTAFSDDLPKRSRSKPKGKFKSERVPKTPMREVVKGQFFGGDDDDFSDEDASDENFASRVNEIENDDQ
jgi:RNA recognition motif-containing protein